QSGMQGERARGCSHPPEQTALLIQFTLMEVTVNTFLGVFHYEYYMSIRRLGFWLAFGLLGGLIAFSEPPLGQPVQSVQELWQEAGTFALQLNILFPVVAGIVLADRLARDDRLGVHELFTSTALRRWT